MSNFISNYLIIFKLVLIWENIICIIMYMYSHVYTVGNFINFNYRTQFFAFMNYLILSIRCELKNFKKIKIIRIIIGSWFLKKNHIFLFLFLSWLKKNHNFEKKNRNSILTWGFEINFQNIDVFVYDTE